MSHDHFHVRVLNAKPSPKSFLDALKYDRQGLISVIAQDALTGEVLMLAHADRKALEKTLRTGVMHYYSRSRRKSWKKGEDSGHEQLLDNLFVDCDGDALVARVRQIKAACHLGYRSCFAYHVNRAGKVLVTGRKVFDPQTTYSDHAGKRPSR